jgi:carbon monoxide dehydrogenase subunit G
MVDVTRTFTVKQTLPKVTAYLRDFANAEAWDPGTEKCEQITAGPVAVGTQWHNTTKMYGLSTELTYSLETDETEHIVFRGENKTATSVDDLTFSEAGPQATQITYHAHIEFNGIAKLADPIAGVAFERVGDETVDAITAAVEKLA